MGRASEAGGDAWPCTGTHPGHVAGKHSKCIDCPLSLLKDYLLLPQECASRKECDGIFGLTRDFCEATKKLLSLTITGPSRTSLFLKCCKKGMAIGVYLVVTTPICLYP